MTRSANQILLKIKDSANPLTLQLKPDGSLSGTGVVQVNGRVIVGTTEDPNNPFVFAPKPGRCEMGSLFAGGTATTSAPVSQPAAAASSAPTTSTPVNSNQAPVPASLSIASGFSAQPGVANPLAGKTVLVIRESFESILAKAGWVPQGSSTGALTVWARACQTRQPACQQGIEQMRPYLVASAQLDASGKLTFGNARSGSYYLVTQTVYNGLHLVWNLRVDLKPGVNSVTLDQGNTTPIDR